MTSPDNTVRPPWLDTLKGVCLICQKDTTHLAFIEEKMPDGSVLVSDYHHCKSCHSYAKTTSSIQNYAAFHANTLSKRNPPVIFDKRYLAVTTLPAQPTEQPSKT